MLQPYNDIRDKLGEPLWYDECGVPRYEKFCPGLVNNICANEVALIDIACELCGQEFRVAMATNKSYCLFYGTKTLSQQISDKSLHYGDLPIHDSCSAGSTMNCRDLKVIEFWNRNMGKWVRCGNFEIDLIE